MKKLFFIMLIIPFMLITGCSSSTLEKISFNELKEKISNKETFVIYFTGDDDTLKDKLETALNSNNLTGFYIDSSKITNDEKLALEKDIAYEESSIIFIINGNDPTKLSHITNKDITEKEITARLIDMNFIKTDNKKTQD